MFSALTVDAKIGHAFLYGGDGLDWDWGNFDYLISRVVTMFEPGDLVSGDLEVPHFVRVIELTHLLTAGRSGQGAIVERYGVDNPKEALHLIDFIALALDLKEMTMQRTLQAQHQRLSDFYTTISQLSSQLQDEPSASIFASTPIQDPRTSSYGKRCIEALRNRVAVISIMDGTGYLKPIQTKWQCSSFGLPRHILNPRMKFGYCTGRGSHSYYVG